MLKTSLLFCSLFIGCMLSASAQKWQLSVEGGAQQPWIPNYVDKGYQPGCPSESGHCSTTYYYDIDYSYQERPSGYLNAFAAYSQSERLQFYHTLGLSLMRYQSSVEVQTKGEDGIGNCYERDEQGNVVIVACENRSRDFFRDERTGKTSLLYLSQELGARYKVLPRLWVQGGMDVSYRLHSQLYTPVLHFSEVEGYTVSMHKDRSGTGFAGVLLGVHTGLAYDLTDKLSLSMGLQHSLTPIYNDEMIAGKGYQKSRASQLRLGVAYKLKGW